MRKNSKKHPTTNHYKQKQPSEKQKVEFCTQGGTIIEVFEVRYHLNNSGIVFYKKPISHNNKGKLAVQSKTLDPEALCF